MEDNRTKDEKENQALIEEMIEEAKKGETLGEVSPGMVVDKGEGPAPMPAVVSSITGGGKVKVYDTLTGEPSWVLFNPDTGGSLRTILRKRREDGSPVYSLKQMVKPVAGTYKCLLHKDTPNRVYYDTLGFAVCPKGDLASPYQVRRHMQKRHPAEWAAIEQERTDAERQEDRAVHIAVLESIATKQAFTCEECGKSFSTRIALEGHKRSHSK